MKTFIFPFNYDYSNKFLGIFEYKIITPFCIIGLVLAIILTSLNVPIMISVYIFILGFLPIFLLANTTLFKEPLIHFLICIIKHYTNAHIYKKSYNFL